jgi:hypothetical protein
MTRRNGRRRAGRLADLSITPPDPPRYNPPPHNTEYDFHQALAPHVWMHAVRRYHRDRLVGFAVTLDQWTGTEWRQIVRI